MYVYTYFAFVSRRKSACADMLAFVFTERDDRTRIISARSATRIEQDEYFREDR